MGVELFTMAELHCDRKRCSELIAGRRHELISDLVRLARSKGWYVAVGGESEVSGEPLRFGSVLCADHAPEDVER